MAFIRRVRTKSGATAVQIAEYADGKQRIIRHIGSAHTDAELGILLARANELLAPDQGMLDFEVSPRPPITPILSQMPQLEKLFPDPRQRLVLPSAGGGRDGPGRVQATNSVLLGQVLTGVYGQLGFDVVGDEVFEDLVIARIVEPTSKLDGQVPCSGVAVGSFVEGCQALSSSAMSGWVLTSSPVVSAGVRRQRARTSSPR